MVLYYVLPEPQTENKGNKPRRAKRPVATHLMVSDTSLAAAETELVFPRNLA